MKCDLCDKNESKYKYFEVDSNTVKELHICEECARKKGIITQLNKSKTLSGRKKCKNCSLSFQEFKKDNKLGCKHCYDSFRNRLRMILRQIHPDVKHCGKEITKNPEIISVKNRIRKLQKKLEVKVQKEKYEEAVNLRDKIEEYQKELENLRGTQ